MADYTRLSKILPLALTILIVGCAPKGEALYARAEKSLGKGDVRAAIIDLKALIQTEPQNGKARALLGIAMLANGDPSGAEIELQKAADLGAPKDMLLVPNCRVLLAKGEPEKVLEGCKPETGPASAQNDLRIVTGGALVRLNRAPEAREQFAAAFPDGDARVLVE